MSSRLWRVLHWMPVGAWLAALFLLSARPAGPEPGPWILSNDKVDHAVAYGILTALLFLALRRGHGWPARRAALVAMAASSLYGISDELHQRFVPTRTPDVLDWLADTAGAALAAIGAGMLARRRLSHRSSRDCPAPAVD